MQGSQGRQLTPGRQEGAPAKCRAGQHCRAGAGAGSTASGSNAHPGCAPGPPAAWAWQRSACGGCRSWCAATRGEGRQAGAGGRKVRQASRQAGSVCKGGCQVSCQCSSPPSRCRATLSMAGTGQCRRCCAHLGGRGGRCLAPGLLLLLLGLAAGRLLLLLLLLLLAHKIDLKLLQAGRRAGRQAMAGCWLAEMGG